jgi:ribosomal protein L25 (general stress protein Ctc)
VRVPGSLLVGAPNFRRFVRIVDPGLAEDYSLRHLPALAFFRQHTPILYTGDINNQEEVFEFLFQNKHTAEEDVIVEDVDAEKLEILINHVDFVVVLFYAVSLFLFYAVSLFYFMR